MSFFFFFNDTATTEIYTLSYTTLFRSLRPVLLAEGRFREASLGRSRMRPPAGGRHSALGRPGADRKSTRLNSSHSQISYAVFCLKKKKDVIRISNETLYYETELISLCC